VPILIEKDDVRAVRGGTGYAKCGGNYAGAMRAGEKAEKNGFFAGAVDRRCRGVNMLKKQAE